jgi:hypothetical protein
MNKRLRKLPIARTGYQVRGSLANDVPAFGGADYNAYIGKPSPQVRKTMGAVPREEANLEAEGGETLVGDLDGSTFPSFFNIKGPRHSAGGVPMNLPDDTFIFSDTASMKITDPKILKMFNKSVKKGGYTPAELSKAYDINKYRKTLQDPESNKMERKTAEMMIKNYVMKLGALAIAQESKKGFPQGIPVIAEPYMEANKITEADLIPEVAKQQQEQQQMMAQQQGAPQGEMMPQEGAPTQMPSGEPIAQPSMEEQMQGAQEMSPEQMQGAPMAMYGMEMGGYDVPFAAYGMAMGVNSNNYMGRTKHNLGSGPFLNREMAKQGLIVGGMLGMPVIMSGGGYIDMYDGGGQKKSKEQLQKEIDAKNYENNIKKVKKFDEDVIVFDKDGKKIGARGTSDQQNKDLTYNKRKDPYVYNKGREEAYIKGLCERMKNGDLKGYTVDDLVKKNLIVAAAGSKLAGCETKSESDVTEFFELEETPETGCQCEDPNKDGYQEKDENGKCPCDKEKCYCIDPETGKDVEVALTNGECICEEEGGGGGYGAQAQSWQIPMQWTPQDERNLATAMRTRTGIEYPTAMTYQYPEVELAKEEWLSKVQGLQGQAAKNLDVLSGTAGSSTAKRATAASLQGDVAEGIVNAIASTQARNVGTENQERLTNYQGDVAEGQNRQNILNQYMDKVGAVENMYRGELNAKDALTTQMINQGDTNAANIYNLQTEQYGIDPRTGKQIFKTGKPLSPEQEQQSEIEYAQSLKKAGLEDDEREILLKARYSRFGGPVLQMGGMVYGDMVYPFYYYE